MAIIQEPPLELEAGVESRIAERPLGVFTRPQGDNGWRDWLSTVDHKRIGILYGVSAMVFFVVGGMMLLVFRESFGKFAEQIWSDIPSRVLRVGGSATVAFGGWLIYLSISP